jgi:hypothetical protein
LTASQSDGSPTISERQRPQKNERELGTLEESRIGDIDDVLVDKSGKVTGLVLGVGGFLGAAEKDIIVPFAAVKTMKKNDKWWLTLDETKDDLKNASGFKYDKASTTWVPEKK